MDTKTASLQPNEEICFSCEGPRAISLSEHILINYTKDLLLISPSLWSNPTLQTDAFDDTNPRKPPSPSCPQKRPKWCYMAGKKGPSFFSCILQMSIGISEIFLASRKMGWIPLLSEGEGGSPSVLPSFTKACHLLPSYTFLSTDELLPTPHPHFIPFKIR